MTHLYDLPAQPLQCYTTAPYPCSYLEGQEARSQVVAPGPLVNHSLYSRLVEMGFRRSGLFTYRPHCHHCRACIPVRVAVESFCPDRSQQRAWRKHASLVAQECPLTFDAEHYELYTRYQQARHREPPAGTEGQDQYSQFLLQTSVTTRLIEFRDHGILRMVSLIDVLDQGLSSVYTFYDPHFPQASFGTYNILWQIEECRRIGLPWLFLGYWIRASAKMAYKSRFQPLQGWLSGQWHDFSALVTLLDTPSRESHC
ncbi:MAG: arginyltransferase [Ferrovum sp.]|nr:arginyltransferase [Ferrovum sp.]NDU88108.1 arginyltransferase [Ferrovum sp.]